MKTIQQARNMLKPGKPRKWTSARRRAVFGLTKSATEKQLVSMIWCGKRITVHSKVVNSLKAIETRIRNVEREKGWQPWVPNTVETYNWRTIRGGKSLSRHAHAIALDIDSHENGYYQLYRPSATTTIPMRVIQAFIDEGWTWGGNWNKPLDIMHFQYA